MYKQLILRDLKQAITKAGLKVGDIELSIPDDTKFGDYTTNIPLQMAKLPTHHSHQSSIEIANKIIDHFGHPDYLERIDLAGPGFINFYIKDAQIMKVLDASIKAKPITTYSKKYLVEYGHPNTHKDLHIAHLRTLTIGESLARLLEFAGQEVYRADYGSDIGLPVAKALWGLKHLEDFENVRKSGNLQEKAAFLGRAYAYGHKSYEDDPAAKPEIDQINTQVYNRDPEIVPLWEETKQWSLVYFDSIYTRLGTEYDIRINESEVDRRGKEIVMANMDRVFIKDDGAIIFPGERYGLHNRVFINSAGNPTYEAKELGLTEKEEELFPFDISLHVVDTQQIDFFKVVNKALELIEAKYKNKKRHIAFGFVSLTTGRMSSRSGNIVPGEELIDQVTAAIKKVYAKDKSLPAQIYEKIAIGAIKFYYLKYSLLSDIVFDVQKSVSLQGDTGSYVMYTFARTNSLLEHAKGKIPEIDKNYKTEVEEREVLRQLEYFLPAVERATEILQPNELTSYLLNLSKAFNLFYQKYPIVGSKYAGFRLSLTKKVGEVLASGLYLLGIEAVEKI